MTSEQSALLHKARESIRAASVLHNDGLYGFAAARAYYAMFYVAQALLLAKKLSFSKHSAVIAAFGRHLVKSGDVAKEFHRYLIDAQQKRTIGDYDTGSIIHEHDSNELIARAQRFIELADTFAQL